MFIDGFINALRRKIQSNDEDSYQGFIQQNKRRKYTEDIKNAQRENQQNCPKLGYDLSPKESLDDSYVQAVDMDMIEPSGPKTRRRFSTNAKTTMQMTTLERIEKMKERFRLDSSESDCGISDGENEAECCCICLYRRASVRTYPCGHQVFCRLCATSLIQSLFACGEEEMWCVICRANIAALRHKKKNMQINERTKIIKSINNRRSDVEKSLPNELNAWRRWRHSSYKKKNSNANEKIIDHPRI